MKNLFFRNLATLIVLFFVNSCVQTDGPKSSDADSVLSWLKKISTYYAPDGKGPFPAVVIMHSGLGVLKREHHMARKLTTWGYAALIVDTYGSRSITGTRSIGYEQAARLQLGDADGAIMYLASKPEVDIQRIGILGFSRGGHTVLNAISETQSLPHYLATVDRHAKPFRAGVAYFPHCVDHETLVLKGALLILVGSEERAYNYNCSHAVVRAARVAGRAAEIKVYEGARHGFYGGRSCRARPDRCQDSERRTKAFFDTYLKGASNVR